MRKIKPFQFLAILFCLGLGSCATMKDIVNPYDEEFHCRAKDTEGKCVATPTAYQDARYPQPTVEMSLPTGDGQTAAQDPSISPKAKAKASQYKAIAELLDNPEPPLLNPPKVVRVLILPYKGEKNELFMTRYAYLEIEKAAWVLTDIKEK